MKRTRKPKPSRKSRAPLAVLALLLVLTGAWIIWRQWPSPPPAIDFAKVDPLAATLIHKHLDEVAAQPRSGDAWGRLGMVLRAAELPSQAGQCLARAQQLDPRNPRWPYFQALLAGPDSPRLALQQLRETVRLCGNEPEAPRYRLAILLAEAGEWNDTAVELRALVSAKPAFTPAQLLLARRERARGSIPAAMDLAARCTEDPRTAKSAWTLLAALHQRQGDTPAAAQAAGRAAALPADAPVADPFEVEAALLRDDPRKLNYQTHSLLASGRLDEAWEIIDHLLKAHPDFAEAWLLLGRYQLLRKALIPAEQALRRHLELDPKSTQALFQLGSALLGQERWLEAADCFQQATRIKPDFGPAFYNRGLALAHAGRLPEAADALRESIRHNPEHLESYFMLVQLYLKLGDRATASQYFDTAQALSPGDPRVLSFRAQLGRSAQKN